MGQRANLLNCLPGFAMVDSGTARDRIGTLFGATHFDAAGSNGRSEVRFLQLPELSLIHAEYAGAVSLGFGEATYVRQYFTLGGAGRFVTAGSSGDMTVDGSSTIVPAHTAVRFEFSSYDQLVLRIEQAALVRHLSVLIDDEVNDLVFEPQNTHMAGSVSLRRAVLDFAADHNQPQDQWTDLVRIETARMLIMRFLINNWHNHSLKLHRTPPAPSALGINRVRDFLAANWDKPLDIQAMAAIAGVSARSVFRHFQKRYGCSPLQFTKQLRLQHAKSILEEADQRATVLSTAFRCGFQNPSHFARDFREAFGELPSNVLRRASRRP